MLVVPTKSPNKDAGWAFLEFWCGLGWMLERFAIGSWLAPRKDFYETAEYKAALQELPVLNMVPHASASGTPLVYIQQSALDAVIKPILEAAILQELEPEAAIEQLIEECNTIMVEAGYAS